MGLARFGMARLTAVVALVAMLFPLSLHGAELTILHLNDVYEISPKNGKGGLAEVTALIKKERARARNTLLTFGGDLLSPSVMSGLTRGAQMINLFNTMGFDAAGLGNHEFDFGPDILRQRISDSKFPWVATNTLDLDGKPFGGTRRLIMRKFDDLNVGIFALLTEETQYLANTKGQVKLTDSIEAAKAAVRDLRKQGADIVIAITHLGFAEDRALARNVSGVDVIVGGHDHDAYSAYEGNTLIVKAGSDAHFLAVVDLKIEKIIKKGKERIAVSPEWKFLSTSGVKPDTDMARAVKKHEDRLGKSLDQIVGKTAVELITRRGAVRTRETRFGNLIADAIRAETGADVALLNGGGIRGGRVYEAGATLTRRDILTELPFGNVAVLIRVSGRDLREALENGLSGVEEMAGRFAQVSGMKMSYDPAAAKGSRIHTVTIGGKPLNPDALYKVATSDYLGNGGDGYKALTRGEILINASGARLITTMVMDHIAKAGTIAPKIENRIARQ